MMGFLSKLSARERWLVLGTAVFLCLVLLFALVVNPVVDNKQKYERMAREKRQDLAQFHQFASEYRSLQLSLEELQKRIATAESDVSLLAAMESNARKLGLAEKIASMKPFTTDLESGMVQSSVEMRVEKVDLKGLVEFIESIEKGPNMAVTTRLRIKTRFDDPALLDSTILVTTLEAR